MITYEQANVRYERSNAPKSSAKWLAMPDKPRYLRNVGMTHYGIHKKEDGSIYYRCYDTPVITFHPRQSDGSYQVDACFVNSTTTINFIWAYGLFYGQLETSSGDTVHVPYVQKGGYSNAAITAKLVFDKENKLIVSRSWHEDIYTKVVSSEEKLKRKHLRDSVKYLLELHSLMMNKYKDNVTLSQSYGMPFATAHGNMPNDLDNLTKTIRAMLRTSVVDNFNFSDNSFIADFMQAGQGVFDILASCRAYNQRKLRYINTWNKTPQEIKEQEDEMRKGCANIVSAITFEDFRNAYLNRLLSDFNLKEGTDYKVWGQFRERLPYKWVVKY